MRARGSLCVHNFSGQGGATFFPHHVKGHLQQVHHHDRHDNLSDFLLQIIDGTDAQPAQLLELRVSHLTLSVASREEELVGSQAKDQAHHTQKEAVKGTHSRRHKLLHAGTRRERT